MRHAIVGLSVLCAVLAVGWSVFAADNVDKSIEIAVSPSTLFLDSQGVWVTVHADIPYSTVAGITVTLNGVPVEVTKADNRGDLVAKFPLDAVKDIVAPPSAELTLSGVTKDGLTFSGTDTVRVTAGAAAK